MKKNFTIREKSNGELAVRMMSKNARNCYDENEITIFEYLDKNLNRRYAVDFAGSITDELTLDETEKYLEELYDELNRDED